MSTDSADTRYPHLDLGDLIGGAAGQPVDDRAKEHLAGCEQCQREANRWNLVADGVRALAAAASESAQPALPKGTRPRTHAPWRRAMLAAGSVAAAFVLLVGIGVVTGTVHVHFSGSGSSSEPVLTAVTGCSELQQADGKLDQVNGSSLVIQTASGRPVTVTTTASTFVSMSAAPLSAIADGASVEVRGYRSDGTIRAAIVTVGQPFSAVNPSGFVPLQGTVSDASSTGFTLVTSTGNQVVVTTSSGTLVVVPHASLSQLQPGATIFALGDAQSDGTLLARAVAAVSQLPPGVHFNVSVKNCSSSSIIEALGGISAAGASGG
jgi:Domain of unknown function (DUF5666)